MEEEIQDKLEKIYNDNIRIEVNKFDEWTECEKRGCQGCFHNKYKNIKKYFVKLTKEQLNSLYGRMMNNEKI